VVYLNKGEKMKTDCFKCKYRRNIPGEFHISCRKPDPEMIGHVYGINNGWFIYPENFDPVWRAKECANFEEDK
jgi:hypothetical protein